MSVDNKFSFHLNEIGEAVGLNPIVFSRLLPSSFTNFQTDSDSCKITLTSATIDLVSFGDAVAANPTAILQSNIPQFWVCINGLGIKNQTFVNLKNRVAAAAAGQPEFVNNNWFQVPNNSIFSTNRGYNIATHTVTDNFNSVGCGNNNLNITKICSNSFSSEIQVSVYYNLLGNTTILNLDQGQKFSLTFDIEFIKN
tara:strand:- start:644 stop:1234 length:591 start_codon:yes stop_codon:yes gene_type:complete